MAAGTHDFFANLGHFQGIIICLYNNKSSRLQTPSDMSDKICAGVPVYLAPWTACPPGGKLSRDILTPALVILTPGGQAVQAGSSCPPPI